ncbi:hypothetical protein [Hirschia litorea]|uniref:Uncharacterized protein n=1 Tax=Hirschia litorea TaxID=1199156 RepID=A0ABW2INI2_9PROT
MTLFIIILISLAAWGAYILFRYKSVESDAYEIFNALKGERFDYARLGQESFVAIYRKVHNPFAHVVNFCATITALIALPVIFFFSTWIYNFIWNATGQISDLDEGFAPWLFAVSILCILGLIGIGAIFARLYHLNRPKSLEDEIKIQLEGNSTS